MMTEKISVLLSGFADEAANEKLAVQQYSAFAALGQEIILLVQKTVILVLLKLCGLHQEHFN